MTIYIRIIVVLIVKLSDKKTGIIAFDDMCAFFRFISLSIFRKQKKNE